MSSTTSAVARAPVAAGDPRSLKLAREAVKAARRHLKQVKLQLKGARAAVKAAKRVRKKMEEAARDARLRAIRAAAAKRAAVATKRKAPAQAKRPRIARRPRKTITPAAPHVARKVAARAASAKPKRAKVAATPTVQPAATVEEAVSPMPVEGIIS